MAFSDVLATTGGMSRPGSDLSSLQAPQSWSELMAMADLPSFNSEFAGTQGPVVRDIPGYGKVTFSPQNYGSMPWSVSYTDANGREMGLTTNTQPDNGGPTNNIMSYVPVDKGHGLAGGISGIWDAVKVPVMAAVGANALAGAMGTTAGSGLGATGTAAGTAAAGTAPAAEGGFSGMVSSTAPASGASALPDASSVVGPYGGMDSTAVGGLNVAAPVSASGAGIDQIGSDWATGQATGAPGGMLPTTSAGLTAANTAAASGVPGSVNYGGSSLSIPSVPGVVSLPGSANTPGSGGSLGSLAGLSALLPGLAMGASILKKPNEDTSALSGMADALKNKAATEKPDTSGLSAISKQLSGPDSLSALLSSEARSLIPSVSTGNLPAGAQTLVQNALNDAQTSIKSHYASLGLTGSTMEAQELSAANARAQGMAFNFGQQLTQTGLSEAAASSADLNSAANIEQAIINAGLSASGLSTTDLADSAAIYNQILQTQLAQDTSLQQALANFASASAIGVGLASQGGGGGGGGLTSSLSSLWSGVSGGWDSLMKSLGIGSSGSSDVAAVL